MPYYLCKMIGTGKQEDPYSPYIANYSVNWVMVGEKRKGLSGQCA